MDNDADSLSFNQSCMCGRTFYQTGAYNNHVRSCTGTKKRMSSAIAKAQTLWIARKKKRVNSRETSGSAIASTASKNPISASQIRVSLLDGAENVASNSMYSVGPEENTNTANMPLDPVRYACCVSGYAHSHASL